jgi:hypothetical protein
MFIRLATIIQNVISPNKKANGIMSENKKSRRIIQNQTLIVTIMILVVGGMIPLGGVIFWLVFGIAPAIIIPSILVVWAIASISYLVMRFHVERQNKKIED